jgi:predicted DNA-binding transcriptional regulator AlpA
MSKDISHARLRDQAVAPWASVTPVGPILRPADAAAYFGVALSTYYALIHEGIVPPFVKLSSRARSSGVPQSWLDAAIAARVLRA